ncbi:MAG: PD40 domain-containing protein [candidate division Zixibacteria bacterium]|nr:PD40 domain-containing protein [candidate division Zixibacteria bacterium]
MKIRLLITWMTVLLIAGTALSDELIDFVDKPRLLNTGEAGQGENHFRPRWSGDGSWLSFELIDDNSLRVFTTVPGSDFIYECRSKQKDSYSGALDLFGGGNSGKLAITRLSWAKQPFNNTAMFCFVDNGVLYKSFAFISGDKPSVAPIGQFISSAKMTGVGKKNGLFIPELGYTPLKGQPPVVFTDNDTGKLFAITEMQNLVQMTFSKPDEAFSDYCAKFKPVDNAAIVFMRAYEGNSELYLIEDITHPEESLKLLLSWKKSDEVAPNWSPDGKKIAFYSNRHKNGSSKKQWDLYYMDLSAGGEPTLLASNIRPDNIDEKIAPPYIGPQWMGDDVIIFISDDKPNKDPMMYVQLSTGSIEILPVGTILNDCPNVYDAGDGTYLLAYTTFGKKTTDLTQPDITNKIYYAKMIFSE